MYEENLQNRIYLFRESSMATLKRERAKVSRDLNAEAISLCREENNRRDQSVRINYDE